MAMKARYTTINGQIVSQNVGGVIHDYLPDPLGHTVALIADDETITHIFDYWPYGQLATLDDLATPFRYGGTYGYYSDTFGSTRMYVRARHLQGGYGRWMTMDPVWPQGSAYAYLDGNPVTGVDPSGLSRQRGYQESGSQLGALEVDCLGKAGTIAFGNLVKNKKCAEAISKRCGGRTAAWILNSVPILHVKDNCIPDKYMTNETGCFVSRDNPNTGLPCKVFEVCIQRSTCKDPDPKVRACVLLFEMANACECMFKGYPMDEAFAHEISSACGCSDLIGGGGSHGG